MASKPQFIYLFICAFLITHRISTVCAQTINCHNVEGSSTLQTVNTDNDIETIKTIIKVMLNGLSLDDKESPYIEIKSQNTLSETDRQEINALIKIILEELIDSDKHINTNETEPERRLVETTQHTVVHTCLERLDLAPVA